MANIKKVIKGAQKAAKMAKRINNSAEKTRRIGGATAKVNPKGKLEVREYMTDFKVKGKVKDIKDNAQMTELNAKRGRKENKITSLKYPSKDYMGIKSRTKKPTTLKVPVKKRGK